MAEPDNSLPLLQVGKLPRSDYATWQEFADDLLKVVRFSNDYLQVVSGAQGQAGTDGEKGDKGEKGDPGRDATFQATTSQYPITSGLNYVDIPVFPGWDKAIFKTTYNGQVDSVDPEIEDFDSAPIGVATIVPVYNGGDSTTTIRVFFTAAAADSFYLLMVTVYA